MRKSTACLTDFELGERVTVPLRRSQRHLSALLDERERIKRDLHDGVLQTLYAAGLGMAAARAEMKSAPPAMVGQINFVVSQLDHAIREIRSFLQRDLAPPDPGTPLDVTLRATIESLVGNACIGCHVTIDPQAAKALSIDQGTQILFIVREALSNVLRHAQAERVTVSLIQDSAGRITLEVQDDGIGFDDQPVQRSHYGMKNLTARAKGIGGRIRILSSPGQGTRLILELDGGAVCLPNL